MQKIPADLLDRLMLVACQATLMCKAKLRAQQTGA
jgi:hypothetical protein